MNKISQILKTAIANNATKGKTNNKGKEEDLTQIFLKSHLKTFTTTSNNTTSHSNKNNGNYWRKIKTSQKFQHSLAALQENLRLTTEIVNNHHQSIILPLKPNNKQWNFITKYHCKKKRILKRNKSSDGNSLKTIHNNCPASKYNSLLTNSSVERIKHNNSKGTRDNNHKTMKQFMNRAIIHSKEHAVPTLITTHNPFENNQRINPMKKSMSTWTMRSITESCSSSIANLNFNKTGITSSMKSINSSCSDDYMQKCLYIKYQKLAYIKPLNQSSSVSGSTATIASTNYGIDNCGNIPYKLKSSCENMITSKQSSYVNNANQSQIIDDPSLSKHQLRATTASVINSINGSNDFFGYNNITWNNNCSNSKVNETERLLSKRITYENFINKKPSETRYDDSKYNIKKEIPIITIESNINSQPVSCKNTLQRAQSALIHRCKIKSICPNKQLLSYLFKGKDKLDNKSKNHQSCQSIIPLRVKEINSKDNTISNNIITLKSTALSSRYNCPNSINQIYHNDTINIIATKQSKAMISMPHLEFTSVSSFNNNNHCNNNSMHNPLKASRKEPFASNSSEDQSLIHKVQMPQDNHPKPFQEIDNEIKNATNESNEANFSLAYLTSTHFLKNTINPTSQLNISLPTNTYVNTNNNNYNNYNSIIDNNCNSNSSHKIEIEKSINNLNPIQTGESLQFQSNDTTPIKIHINKAQIPNPLSSFQIDYTSLSSEFFQSFSIEKILNELINNIKAQYELIFSFDIYEKSTEKIKMMFHLNNQNTLYIKKLLSIESMEPQTNIKRITIFKRNSTLEDILLYELIEMKTHQEITDNINLITDLINNNDVLINEALKEFKKYEGKIIRNKDDEHEG